MCAIVEIDLRPSLIDGRRQHFLRILSLGRSRTNHPDQQHNDDQEDDNGCNATSNIRKFGAFETPWPGERARATARRCALQVFDAGASIITEVITNIGARHSGSIEAGLAFAFEVRRFGYENAVGVRVAVRLAFADGFAWVGAFGAAGGGHRFGAVIWWTCQTRGLLRFRLIEALFAFNAQVHAAIEICTRQTDGQ